MEFEISDDETLPRPHPGDKATRQLDRRIAYAQSADEAHADPCDGLREPVLQLTQGPTGMAP